ncbi:protein DOG1-like 4 [Phaseolus vulgaris]
MANPVVVRFSEFYENWTGKLEDILQQLLQVSSQRTEVVKTEQELQALVSTVTSHLKEYYTTKWGIAHDNVLIFFSPPWLNPLENAQLWMTGWKPSTVFRQVENLKKGNVLVMTEEQEKKMEELKMKIKMEEEKVEREMERQQVAMADRRMVQLSKLTSRARSAGSEMDSVAEVAVKEVLAGLERVMKASDCVRLKTLKGVLDLLTPMQSVDFLAANITTLLRFNQWGKKKKDMAGTVLNANQEK